MPPEPEPPDKPVPLTPAQYMRAHELADYAAAMPHGDREAFIRAACGPDDVLLKEVHGLVEAIGALGSSDELDADELPPGTLVDKYRVEREIGRGGMGCVYLASRADGLFHRQVAIKVVKRALASEDIIARFHRERQILGQFNHPGIAWMLDAGALPDGRPYFVMEYVPGLPITDYADHRALTVPDRLKLFLDVCEAVAFAHSNRVLHRDLKPKNILVSETGVPKLLDFGIAKSFGPVDRAAAQLTATGISPGTPRYSSPEQLRGEATDARTDVYALGVVLFELLTGWWPFVAGAIVKPSDVLSVPATVSFSSTEAAPPAPETIAINRGTTPKALAATLRGDLDAIVSAALREDPVDRYSTVAELVSDLRLYLGGRPILAKRRSLADKWAGISRLWVAAAAIIFASAVIVAGWKLWTAAAPNRPQPPDQKSTTSGADPQTEPGNGEAARSGGRSTQQGKASVSEQTQRNPDKKPSTVLGRSGGQPAAVTDPPPVTTPSPTPAAATPTATPLATPAGRVTSPPPASSESGRTPDNEKAAILGLVAQYAELHTKQLPTRFRDIYPSMTTKEIDDFEDLLSTLEKGSYKMSVATCDSPAVAGDGGQVVCSITESRTPVGRARQLISSRRFFRMEWKYGTWLIAEVRPK